MCFIYRKWSNICITAGNKVKTKTRNILDDWKAFVNTMGIIVPIWNINFFSFTQAQMKWQRQTLMLSYQSQNLEIKVFCTILEAIPLKFLRLWMSEINQSKDLTKIVISLHEVKPERFSPIFMKIIQLSLTLSS